MAKITSAEVRLDEEGFNGMPARAAVIGALEEQLAPTTFEAVDLDKESNEYWQNDLDTLVIAFETSMPYRMGPEAAMHFGTGLAKAVRLINADEYDVKRIRDKTVIRFWWD